MSSMYKPELYIFEPNGPELEVPPAYGPRAVARALGAVFDGAEWDDKHRALCAFLIADFTSGERHVITRLTRELKKADLQVVVLL